MRARGYQPAERLATRNALIGSILVFTRRHPHTYEVSSFTCTRGTGSHFDDPTKKMDWTTNIGVMKPCGPREGESHISCRCVGRDIFAVQLTCIVDDARRSRQGTGTRHSPFATGGANGLHLWSSAGLSGWPEGEFPPPFSFSVQCDCMSSPSYPSETISAPRTRMLTGLVTRATSLLASLSP